MGETTTDEGAMDTTGRRPVVTLWETYGAGMEEVAALVAERLGVEAHSQRFTPAEVAAAGRSGRIGEGDGEIWFLVGATGSSLRGYQRSELLRGVQERNERIAAQITADVRAEAERGGVFMGRAATHILRDWPGALHVQLDGPVRDRIERAAAAQGITLEEAEEQEQWNDEVRSQISIELFGWNPLDNSSYDMVFNTSHMPAATCADLIAGAARAKAERPQPTEPTQQ